MLAPCVTDWPTKQREDLVHAIVYPTKTKPRELSKNSRRPVGNGHALQWAIAAVIKRAGRQERTILTFALRTVIVNGGPRRT
jgi:hypothetical protein